MAEKRINEYFQNLPANSSPSSTTYLVVEENGVTKKIPIDVLFRKDADGGLVINGSLICSDGASFNGSVSVGYGEAIHLYNEDNDKAVGLFCSADGTKLELNNDVLATESYVDEKFNSTPSGGSSTVRGYYDCTVHAGSTMRDLLNDLKSKGYTSGDTMMLKVRESVWAGNYVGYIETWADDSVCKFSLLEISRALLYTYPSGVSTSTDLSLIFGGATRTELGNSSDSTDNAIVPITATDRTSMQTIYDAIVSAEKNPSEPTLIQLQAVYNNLLLMWIEKNGPDMGYVYCWDLRAGKFYRIDGEPVILATVFLDDLFTNYEVPLGGSSSGGSSSPMTYITYDELKDLRNSGSLVPGMFYRITDYQCTTAQENTGAMNNQFDIIIQALDESTLSETASADKHENDTYFADTNFGAWEIKYCLDNDSSRFAWALDKKYSLKNREANFPYFVEGDIFTRCESMDGNCSREGYVYAWTTEEHKESWEAEKCIYTDTEDVLTATNFAYYSNYSWMLYSPFEACFDIICESGKGVIYYMKDEFGNECPYDFKNITYKGNILHKRDEIGLDAETYYPTFTKISLVSYTQWGSTYGICRDSSIDTTIDGVAYYGYVCSSNPSAWGRNTFYITDTEISPSSTMYFIYEDNSVSTVNFGGELSVGTSLDNSSKSHENIVESSLMEYGASLPYVVFIGECYGNTVGRQSTYITFSSSGNNIIGKASGNVHFSNSMNATVGSGTYNQTIYGGGSADDTGATNIVYNCEDAWTFTDLCTLLQEKGYVWGDPMVVKILTDYYVGCIKYGRYGPSYGYYYVLQTIGGLYFYKGTLFEGSLDDTTVGDLFTETAGFDVRTLIEDLQARIAALEGN